VTSRHNPILLKANKARTHGGVLFNKSATSRCNEHEDGTAYAKKDTRAL